MKRHVDSIRRRSAAGDSIEGAYLLMAVVRGDKAAGSYARIYRTISRIPRGRVATYGQIAQLAGLAGHARQVGYALHATPDHLDIPWHRVINAKGEVSARSDPSFDGARTQRTLLEREGVAFDDRGRVRLKDFQWKPRS